MDKTIRNMKKCLNDVLNGDGIVEDVRRELKGGYMTESFFDRDGRILYIWTEAVNESLRLASAREYVDNHIDESLAIQTVYGRPKDFNL